MELEKKYSIETERLRLIPLSLSDVDLCLQISKFPIHQPGFPEDFDIAESYIRPSSLDSFADFGFGTYKLVLKSSGQTIGLGGLNRKPFLKDGVNLHYNILPEFRNQGYAIESINAYLEVAKSLKLGKVYACIDPKNVKSLSLIEKLNFTLENENLKFSRIQCDLQTVKCYSILV